MELIKNQTGYAPLLPNLAGHWSMSFDQLPPELAKLVQERFKLITWEKSTAAVREQFAAQSDYQHDPCLEPALYFKLTVFRDELNEWIAAAREKSQDAVALRLLDVAGRVDEALDLDRQRVGAEIQELRRLRASDPAKDLSTSERNSLLRIVYAMAVADPYKFDPSAPRNEATTIVASATAAAGCSVDVGTVRKYLRQAAEKFGHGTSTGR